MPQPPSPRVDAVTSATATASETSAASASPALSLPIFFYCCYRFWDYFYVDFGIISMLNKDNAVYCANRAFAHTKLEEYGSAIQDATAAIEIDPKYSKGYYRRGAAYLAKGKFKDALRDFQQALWDKMLEFRFLLQKPFSSCNRLPEEQVKSLYCNADNEVSEAYSDVIASSKKTLASIFELQQALIANNPSITRFEEE